MGRSKRKIVRTVYAILNGSPVRIEISEGLLERVGELQKLLRAFPRKRNEHLEVIVHLSNVTILVTPHLVDIGRFSFDGWDSCILELTLKKLSDLPEVYFSLVFKETIKEAGDNKFRQKQKEQCLAIMKKKHKELLVWEKLSDEKTTS